MNLTRELIFWLESQTSFIAGDDLFQGVYPLDHEYGIMLKQIDGQESESNLQSVNIHISSLAEDYDTSFDNIEIVYNLFAHSRGIVISGVTILNSTPLKMPSFVAVTEHNRYLFTCSIICHYERV